MESAAAGGDTYSVEETLVVDSVATIVGTLVGCPFPGAVFIGHPAYKKMGARCGYLALNSSARDSCFRTIAAAQNAHLGKFLAIIDFSCWISS